MRIPNQYVVIDTETTGLPSLDDYHNSDFTDVGIIEIGALSCITHEHEATVHRHSGYNALVSPWGDGEQVLPPFITDLTGITAEMIVEDGIEPLQAFDELNRYIGDTPVTVVGQNICAFDMPLLLESGYLPDAAWEVLDTRLIWTAWCRGLQRAPWETLPAFFARVNAERFNGQSNLGFLLRTLCGPAGLAEAGFTSGAMHRASADCVACHLVFEAMRVNGILSRVLGPA